MTNRMTLLLVVSAITLLGPGVSVARGESPNPGKGVIIDQDSWTYQDDLNYGGRSGEDVEALEGLAFSRQGLCLRRGTEG